MKKKSWILCLCFLLLSWNCSTPPATGQEQTPQSEAAGQKEITTHQENNGQQEPVEGTPDASPPEPTQEATGQEQTITPDQPSPEKVAEPIQPEQSSQPEAQPEKTQSCGAITTFSTGKKPSQTLYVSAQGNDSSGDGSSGKPYKTVQHAARQAKPGTAIRIKSGTYSGVISLSNIKGTANAPIWIGGEPGKPKPVIQGGGEGLHLTKVQYLVVHDLEIRGARNNGVNCDDGGDVKTPKVTSYVEFRNLKIHSIGSSGNQDCLKLSGLYHFYVLDSHFSKCGGGGSGSGVDHVGCHHGLLARNTFENMSGNAIQCKGGSSDLEIRWNKMFNAGHRTVNMGGSTGFQYFRPPLSKSKPNAEARDIRVVANIIEGATASLAFVGCENCLAAHNTIINPQKWVFRILQETRTKDGYTFVPASKGKVINNLIYFKRSQVSTFINIGSGTDAKSFVFSNNLWYAQDRPGSSKPSLPSPEKDGVVGKDPLLQNPGQKQYSLKAGSPAIGKGMILQGVKGDITGACYATPPAIGAYEHRP